MEAVQEFRVAITRQLDELEAGICKHLKCLALDSNGIEHKCCDVGVVEQASQIAQLGRQPRALHLDGVQLIGSYGDTDVVKWNEDIGSPRTPRTPGLEERMPSVRTVVQNWITLIEGVFDTSVTQKRNSSLRFMNMDSMEAEFHLRPGWVMSSGGARAGNSGSLVDLTPDVPMSSLLREYMHCYGGDGGRHCAFGVFGTQLTGMINTDGSCMQSLVLHPDSRSYMIWMFLGVFMVWYDVITFPLVVFSVEDVDFTNIMTWVTSAYWFTDIFVSCLVGFHRKSKIEMRPSKILQRYIRTWFFVDLSIVSIDCLFLMIAVLAHTHGPGAGLARVGRSFRGLRFLRATRLVRLIKSCKQVAPVIIVAVSDVMLVIGRLALIIVSILVINHYIACGWFALAVNNRDDPMTWVKAFEGENQSPSAWYASSLHWSLTQFTPATNNISPYNSRERWFAIFVVVFALVMFSNFLSSLTNAFVEIRQLHAQKIREEADLRYFLLSRRVSIALGHRIWHFYQGQYLRHTFHLHEDDIPVLRQLPTSIKGALHMEIYVPTLNTFPICWKMSRESLHTILHICCVAITERPYIFGGEIFDAGSESTEMKFLVSGAAWYDNTLFDNTINLEAPAQIAETTLWTNAWRHYGKLSAASPCLLLGLNADRFEEASLNFKAVRALQMYASLHLQLVMDSFQTNNPIMDVFEDQVKVKFSKVFARVNTVFGNMGRAEATMRVWRSMYRPRLSTLKKGRLTPTAQHET